MNSTESTKLKKMTLEIAAAAIVGGGTPSHSETETPAQEEPVLQEELVSKEQNAAPDLEQIRKNLTFGEYKKMLAPITPYVMLQLILNEGMKLDETGEYCIPYLGPRDIWTIAFGVTTTSDGKKVTQNTKPIPVARAWDESVHFLETRETYFLMYCYDVGCPDLHLDNAGRACAFASIFYGAGSKFMEEPNDKNHRERNETLRKLYKKYGEGVTAEMVRECFEKYPIVAPRSFGALAISGASDQELANILGIYMVGGRGLWVRRWLEGQILMGNIAPKDFLNLPIQGTYEFFQLMGGVREVFWLGEGQDTKINMETLAPFQEWLKEPVTRDGKTKFSNRTIGELLASGNPYILERFAKIKYELADITQIANRSNVKTMTDSLYFLANADFLAGNYMAAAEKFEKLAEQNPTRVGIFNNLAATYNKMGEYDHALAVVEHIIEQIKDESGFAAAYYNAGVAYEGLGKPDQALENYNLAIENGNQSRSVRSAIKRIASNKRAKYTGASRGRRRR